MTMGYHRDLYKTISPRADQSSFVLTTGRPSSVRVVFVMKIEH